jgi:hypothetical protein
MNFPILDLNVEIIDKNGNVPLQVYFGGITIAAIMFLLSLIPAHYISILISSTFRNGKRRISWYSYCLSQFHGPTSGWFAIYCVYNTVGGENNINWYYHPTEIQVLCVLWTLGYMVVDLTMVFVFKKEFGFPLFLIFHHALIIVTYSMCLLMQPAAGVYFMCAFQCQELTATFLANRWFLLECDMKYSDLYWYNGYFLVGGYIITRIFYGNYVVYQLLTYLPTDVKESPLKLTILGMSVVFQLLQYYFFYKIIATTFKYMQTRKLYFQSLNEKEKKQQ